MQSLGSPEDKLRRDNGRKTKVDPTIGKGPPQPVLHSEPTSVFPLDTAASSPLLPYCEVLPVRHKPHLVLRNVLVSIHQGDQLLCPILLLSDGHG